jgi:hypothetical protein
LSVNPLKIKILLSDQILRNRSCPRKAFTSVSVSTTATAAPQHLPGARPAECGQKFVLDPINEDLVHIEFGKHVGQAHRPPQKPAKKNGSLKTRRTATIAWSSRSLVARTRFAIEPRRAVRS